MGAAHFSPCGHYRYALTRTDFNPNPVRLGGVLWVMLNPSTATADHDDATIRRCMSLSASHFGVNDLAVVNLYALRSTDPAKLWKSPDPVGPENDRVLRGALRRCAQTGSSAVFAWGAQAEAWRVETVADMARGLLRLKLFHLGLTKDGQPRHPLYNNNFPQPLALDDLLR